MPRGGPPWAQGRAAGQAGAGRTALEDPSNHGAEDETGQVRNVGHSEERRRVWDVRWHSLLGMTPSAESSSPTGRVCLLPGPLRVVRDDWVEVDRRAPAAASGAGLLSN